MTTAGMRFSLTSDTHGNLGVINDLAARVQADAVIHAGDFGFYDSREPPIICQGLIGVFSIRL